MLLGKFKVSGHSMEPIIKSGQEIIISSLPYLILSPKIKDIISFKDGEKFIVKRIKGKKNSKYLIRGDNKKDSKEYGWIERKRIIGKVIYIFSQ